ncbi:hypothetical protein [Rhizobium sp. LjRoot258]
MRLFNWPWGDLQPHPYDFIIFDFAWSYSLRSAISAIAGANKMQGCFWAA